MSNTDEKTARDLKRLVAAARALVPYLNASDDLPKIFMTDLVYRGPESNGAKLRRQAEEADVKDEAIKKFRIALAQFEE